MQADEAPSSTDTLEGLDASAALDAGDDAGAPAAEFEPQEGASATLAADSRRELRRLEQQPAAVQAEQVEPEVVGETPDPTTYDLQATDTGNDADPTAPGAARSEPAEPEFTSLQMSGEMLSVDTEASAELPYVHQTAPQDEGSPADPARFETAVHDRDQPVEEAPLVSATDQDTEEDTDDELLGVHAYGEGDFHEEELDEELDSEEFEYQASYSASDEGEGEYEEVTLDEGAEDSIAPYEAAPARVPAPEEDAAADTITYTGGFTEADFGGEPAEDDAESETAPREPQQRESRRTGGTGRERRGGRAGTDRGRGGRRQSVQTMDLPAINELLKPGQEILVQIAKEPIAKKGARITSHIALPGRFLVFMPTVNHTGVSRKISSDEERRRLKSLLLAEKGEAQGGFIVRTAAAGASDDELRNDLFFIIIMCTEIYSR